ncbi:MAG: nucleotidyltransferase domain-containing protein [Candidatus Aerophobetes bacterium]|nr:nucleotidyltransferase domain-containing protein [Candidatus Aerophobetes bacterium]
MVKRKIVKAVEILEKLFQKRGIEIYKIVIFGSYAKGEEKKESDLDIIVVSENFEDKDIFEKVEIVSGIHRELVEKITIPVDIMYYSPTEWEKGSSLIINAAREEGKVVYENGVRSSNLT